MAKVVTHKITVRGERQFPIDMLRYDRVTPSTEMDSEKISGTFMRGSAEVDIEVRCEAVKMWRPTDGRWESFGWRVVEHETL